MIRDIVFVLFSVSMAGLASTATPPDLLNYQGVLRDASDTPLDGDHDMVFTFFKSNTIGLSILVDRHTALGGNAVTVSGGLFNAQLGGGDVSDGTAPGTYTSLADVFRDYSTVYLEIEVDGETLSPRIRVISAGYALNSAHLAGRDPDYFLNTSGTAQEKPGSLSLDAPGDVYGLESRGGTGGGYFEDSDNTGRAYVATTDFGIVAEGENAGGIFENLFLEDCAFAAVASFEADQCHGILAKGWDAGGAFENYTGGGSGSVGGRGYGISASGTNVGGSFGDKDDSGRASVAKGDTGIEAYGSDRGGYFYDSNSTGYAYIGYGNYGIYAMGDGAGGFFEDHTSGIYGRIGFGSSSTSGNGEKNFVQNHPLDDDLVIVYASLEGDEVGTYTRGTARLEGGAARVSLGETFQWVTNPEIGLTAQLTPHGDCLGLYVESLDTRELVVRELQGGTGDVVFDYIVHGLRIGFEERPTVREKEVDAYLPDMTEMLEVYDRRPELRDSSPIERFRRGLSAAGITVSEDPPVARELMAAIGRFDPAIHGVARPAPQDLDDTQDETEIRPKSSDSSPLAPASPAAGPAAAMNAAPGFLMPAAGPVVQGQVLVLDPERPGNVRPAADMADPAVVGVALGNAATFDGSGENKALEVPVAFTGLADCLVDAGYGAIRVGDLLTASPTPGHAMRAIDLLPGTILGKAAEPLDAGTGSIKVVVMPR